MTASPAGKGTSPSVLKGNPRVGSDGLKRNENRKGKNGATREKKGKEFIVFTCQVLFGTECEKVVLPY